MDSLLPFSFLIGQLLIGLYFVFFGFWNIYHWKPIIQAMIIDQIPLPWLVLSFGIAWQVFAGFMIIFGLYVKPVAISLIIYTLISIIIFNPFWRMHTETKRLNLSIFVTHLTMTIGGLLILISATSPTLS